MATEFSPARFLACWFDRFAHLLASHRGFPPPFFRTVPENGFSSLLYVPGSLVAVRRLEIMTYGLSGTGWVVWLSETPAVKHHPPGSTSTHNQRFLVS